MASISQLQIELDGIGHVLADKRLGVPKYQRSYAWDRENVEDLLRDIADAIRANAAEYFLGSIVTQGSDNQLEIVDGQQRLATTSICIAAIRDFLVNRQDMARAEQIEQKYLLRRDLRTQVMLPQLSLNADDNDFYRKRILTRPNDPDRAVKPSKESHHRMLEARKYAGDFVESLAKTSGNPSNLLVDWVEYLGERAKVIWVRVPDDSNAFVIFETLNDRGVALSSADLLKNYLFGKSGERFGEAQGLWNQMIGALETVGGEQILLTYIRQAWSARNGITREKDLFAAIKQSVTSEQAAIDLAKALAEGARRYAAMLNPKHELWASFGDSVRGHIETLVYLRLEQFRPLLLAILGAFEKAEVERAVRYLVASSVRFLIHGGSGGGTVEKHYCDSAQRVFKGELKTAKDLAGELNKVVPSDTEFSAAFAVARVSKAHLARYYLRVLERQSIGEKQPELVPNPNSDEVNLEHVLPQNPSAAWTNVKPEDAEAFYNRIGNLCLLQQKLNSEIGNKGFDEKKIELSKSGFTLTKSIGDSATWAPTDIEKRQATLAPLAVSAWSTNIK